MSNYRFTYNANDKTINIPIEIKFDTAGRDEIIDIYEDEVVQKAINPIIDFETTRFSHSLWDNDDTKTQAHYKFYFYNPTAPNDFLLTPPSQANWLDDYENAGFLNQEIYYFANSFKKSFFKLDFYDGKQTQNQKILFSVVLPTQQGEMEPGTLFNNPNLQVMVKKPSMYLDYVGADKEGFFFYWLKNQTFLSQTEMYMSCKFFNAKKGQFVRMMNVPQSNFTGPSVYDFNKEIHFYYKVVFDYSTYEYKIYLEQLNNQQQIILNRIGQGQTNPIKWYEYVNPQ